MVKEHGTTTTVVIKGVSEAASEPGQSCLVVFYGQNLGKRYFLDKDEQIIGRSDSAHICVDQESVSRKHTRIVSMDDGSWRVVDLGSTNGTFVNDQPVADAELRNGDMVRVGQTIFKYLSGTNQKSSFLRRRPIPLFSLFTVLFLFFISFLPYALNLTLNNTPTQVHFSSHLRGY